MSERVLADDFLKWECEGESGDGYAHMNEMARWNGAAAGSRSLDKETCKRVSSLMDPKYLLVVYL